MENAKIDFRKLGRKVRFLRDGKAWSLSMLAEKSGVSKSYISDLENGVAGKPNIQYMYSIALALDVSLDSLLSDTIVRPPATRRQERADLPPGLWELKEERGLTDEEAETLARVNFRGHRPKDKEDWEYLLNTLKLLGRKPPDK